MASMASNRKTAADLRTGRGFLLKLALIAGAAFLLRLGVWAELGAINGGHNSVYTPSVLSDLATYMKLGREIAAGEFTGPFYYQPFYYAVFLPICYLLSGGSIGFVIFIQSLLGAGSCYLAGLAGARLSGKKAGYIAAGFTAISTPLLLYTPFHQNETLQSFNLILLFYLALRSCEAWTLKRWSAVGAVAGIAILTRGNISFFVPGLLAALIWAGSKHRIPRGRIVSGALLFIGFLLLVQLPFIWHNSSVTGKLTGPSTAADAVLALGNSPEAPAGGRDAGLPAGPMEYPEAYSRMMAVAEQGRSVPVQMWEWMRREPGAFFELQFRKLLLFWDYREIPNNVSLYGEGEHSMILRLLLPGRSAGLIAFGLAGLLWVAIRACRRRDVRLWLLLYCVAAYWAATALFYILSRFRAPILPLLAVAAGCFLGWMIRRWRLAPEQRRKLLLYGGGTAVAMFWVTSSSYEFYRIDLEALLMRHVRPGGTTVAFGGAPYWLDYGPLTFGGWQEVEPRPGMKFAKRFPEPFPAGKAALVVLIREPGTLRLRVNGTVQRLDLKAPGIANLEFPVEAADALELEVLNFDGDFRLLCDSQRRYGRSALEGDILPAEWLLRYYRDKK